MVIMQSRQENPTTSIDHRLTARLEHVRDLNDRATPYTHGTLSAAQ